MHRSDFDALTNPQSTLGALRPSHIDSFAKAASAFAGPGLSHFDNIAKAASAFAAPRLNHFDNIAKVASAFAAPRLNHIDNIAKAASAFAAPRLNHIDNIAKAASAFAAPRLDHFDNIAKAASAFTAPRLNHFDKIAKVASAFTAPRLSHFDNIAKAASAFAAPRLTHFDNIPKVASAFAAPRLTYVDNLVRAASAFEALRPSYLDSTISTARSTLGALRPTLLDTFTIGKVNLDTLHHGNVDYSVEYRTGIIFPPYPESHGEAQHGFALDAFLELRAIETEIRSVITFAMSAKFGEGWAESRVPARLLAKWSKYRTNAIENGEADAALLCFADFQDYETILAHEDNWGVVFCTLFPDRDEIISSLRRLNAVRRPTMHSRNISKELLRVLKVEVARLRRGAKLAVH